MHDTVQSLHNAFITNYWDNLIYHCALIILNISQSQGGDRTTTMLSSLHPDLLSPPPCPPPLSTHLSPPLCCLAALPFESLGRPRSPPPPDPFLRPAAHPSTSSYRSPARLPCPVLLRRPRRSRCVPPSPACCCTVHNGKEEEREEEIINRVENKN